MIRRTYHCSECEREFIFVCNSEDPDPDCPNPDCGKVLDWRPKSFAIGGSNEGKAADMAYKSIEQDYGMTNFKDNAKPGELGIVRRKETRIETELVNQTTAEMSRQLAGSDDPRVKQFWGGNAGEPTPMSSMTGQSMIQMAKVGPQGIDPIANLHKLAKGKSSFRTSDMVNEGARGTFENPARKK